MFRVLGITNIKNERKSLILGQGKRRTEQKWDLQADF